MALAPVAQSGGGLVGCWSSLEHAAMSSSTAEGRSFNAGA
jgi:hypothetical protein